MAGTSTHHSNWERGKRKPPKNVSVNLICEQCGIDYVAEGQPQMIKATERAFAKVHSHNGSES